MQRFYSPTLLTCFTSGLLLAALLAVPTATYHISGSVLLTGIAAIVVSAFLYGNSLSSAGLHAAAIRLSPYRLLTETLIVALALAISLTVYVITANQFTFLEDTFDSARVIIVTTLITFLPLTIVIVSKAFKR